jgi:hypothetical protein
LELFYITPINQFLRYRARSGKGWRWIWKAKRRYPSSKPDGTADSSKLNHPRQEIVPEKRKLDIIF